ncbi:MAG: 4Fe-4S dicluster domain-containing protein [Acidobacteriota bacterium]
MKIVKLKEENLNSFLEEISKEADLWAPVKEEPDRHKFQVIEDLDQMDITYTRTILPPRKIILPPSIKMFKASEKEYKPVFSHVSKKIIFGIHPCDIHGLLIMNNFFTHEFYDPYYMESRKNTLLLGHSCWPDEYCLCNSTRTHIAKEGYDLFFSKLEGRYIVWIGSSKGDDLIKSKADLFEEELSDKDIKEYTEWCDQREKAFQNEINFDALGDLMELMYSAPLWEKIGNACLACGSCTNVCPTCNCYNVEDRPALKNNHSDVKRYWDACTLESYSEVAGGENFRKKRADRLRLWYTHKLQAYISKYGKPGCVGCGRCVVTCPVDINVKTVGQSLDGEKVDAFWERLHKEVTK